MRLNPGDHQPPHRPRLSVPAAALLLAGLAACARMGPPPGGPDDKVAPVLLSTVPESVGVYPRWDRDVEFRFDEIISEGSSPSQGFGTGDLEKLILVSPSKGIPVIRWKRDRITLHPREGWKPNRVYRIELLPGLTDLRRNRLDTVTVLTFSTGGAVPSDTLQGIVVDWVAGRTARAALLELVLLPDSLVYRAVTDSSGRYRVGPLPRGDYLVFGAIDQNKNLQRERRESYDSVRVTSGAAVPPLWLIPRDTVGPRITQVAPKDSVSATVTLSQPLDPLQRFDSSSVSLRLQADSSLVPFLTLLPAAEDDSLQRLIRAREDSIRAAADTTRPDTAARPAPPPRPKLPAGRGAAGPKPDLVADSLLKTRPALYDKLVLRVGQPFARDTKYLLEIRGLRSAAGVAGDSRAVLAIPKPPPPPPPADSVAADSAKAPVPADSGAAPAPRPPKP